MSSESKLKFGLAVPIFASPGNVDLRTPSSIEVNWDEIKAAVQRADRTGFDSVWVADHMFLGNEGAILESWTTLSVIAGLTDNLRLVNIHLGNGFRHAPLVAKMAATLDVLSGGRFELFLDPAWRAREHLAYGFEWEPDRATRTRRVGEALEVITQLWTGEPVTFDGEFYQLDDALCRPTPVQAGGPPIWIGESFDEATTRLVAASADGWNSMPAGLDVLESKIRLVDEACESVARDPKSLAKSLETQVLILDSDDEWRQWEDRWSHLRAEYPPGSSESDFFEFVGSTNPELDPGLRGGASYKNEFLIGTREQVTAKLRAYRDLGIDEVVCWFMDFPSTRSMDILINEIRPILEADNVEH